MGPGAIIAPGCCARARDRAVQWTARELSVPRERGGSRRRQKSSGLQEAPELLGPRGMAELAQRLGLDLADALARHREVLADLLQRVLAAVGQAEAQAQHLLLARRERVQHLVRLLAQGEADHRLHRGADLLVLDEI